MEDKCQDNQAGIVGQRNWCLCCQFRHQICWLVWYREGGWTKSLLLLHWSKNHGCILCWWDYPPVSYNIMR